VLETFPDLKVIPVSGLSGGLAPGRADWAPGHPELAGAVRVWPHLAKGEGQFAVLLYKDSAATDPVCSEPKNLREGGPDKRHAAGRLGSAKTDRQTGDAGMRALQAAPEEAMAAFASFCGKEMTEGACIAGSGQRLESLREYGQAPSRAADVAGVCSWWLKGTGLYWTADAALCPSWCLAGLNLEMPGLYVGEWSAGRYEPSSALLHALSPEAPKRRLELSSGEESLSRYLHGETLMREGERGWTAVMADGYALGWGKQEDGFLKNRYPKGWRML
jgi:NOL1/NOP2/fmu family ribosome biogenesis protein